MTRAPRLVFVLLGPAVVLGLSACGALQASADHCSRARTLGSPECQRQFPPQQAGPPVVKHDTPGATSGVTIAHGAENLATPKAPDDVDPVDPPPDDSDPGEPDPGEPEPPRVSDDPRFPVCDADRCYCVEDDSCAAGTCAPDGACLFEAVFVVTNDGDDAVEDANGLVTEADPLELYGEVTAAFLFRDVDVPADAAVETVTLQLRTGGLVTGSVTFEDATSPAPLGNANGLRRRSWLGGAEIAWSGVPFLYEWTESNDLSPAFDAWRQAADPGAPAVVAVHTTPGSSGVARAGNADGYLCDLLPCGAQLRVTYAERWSAPSD